MCTCIVIRTVSTTHLTTLSVHVYVQTDVYLVLLADIRLPCADCANIKHCSSMTNILESHRFKFFPKVYRHEIPPCQDYGKSFDTNSKVDFNYFVIVPLIVSLFLQH